MFGLTEQWSAAGLWVEAYAPDAILSVVTKYVGWTAAGGVGKQIGLNGDSEIGLFCGRELTGLGRPILNDVIRSG